MDLKNNETIIRKGRGNHLRSSGGIGGKLFLTNQRLFFEPHFLNHDTSEASITLENIKSIVTPHSDSFSKKLAIIQSDDLIDFFIVNKRREWLKEIENTVFEIKKARNVDWHNDTEGIQEIENASRLVNQRILWILILAGIMIGFVLFMIL